MRARFQDSGASDQNPWHPNCRDKPQIEPASALTDRQDGNEFPGSRCANYPVSRPKPRFSKICNKMEDDIMQSGKEHKTM